MNGVLMHPFDDWMTTMDAAWIKEVKAKASEREEK